MNGRLAVYAIIDIDLICKLARIGQLDALTAYLRKHQLTPLIQPTMVGTLDLENRRGVLHLLTTPEQKIAVAEFIRGMGVVELDPKGQELVGLCHLVEDIDPGDAIWLAAAASRPDYLVFTGDKRALRAVAKAEACTPIAEALRGRIVILEQLFIELIELSSYVMMRKAVREDPGADTMLASAFPEKATPSSEAIAKLQASVEKLRRETGPLLRP